MKIVNNALRDVLGWLEQFDADELRNYAFLFWAGMGLFLVGVSYYLYSSSSSLVKRLKVLDKQMIQVLELKERNSVVIEKDNIERAFLEKNAINSPLKDFLDKTVTQVGATPEGGWKEKVKVTQWLLDPSFEEVTATLVLKNTRTEVLAKLLEALHTKPAVVVRGLSINKATGSLVVELVVTYRYKKALG